MNKTNRTDNVYFVKKAYLCDETNIVIENAAIATYEGKICWIGKRADLENHADHRGAEIHDFSNCCATPGLIDCHTHLVYAGNRANEFEKRLNGVSYETIAREGGGILSTVNAIRHATLEELVEQSLPRLKALEKEGVTTVEIKSGYGLDTENEIKILKAIQRLQTKTACTLVPTFLGAHALPPEFKGNSDGYIDLICNEMIPLVAKEALAEAVDGFCETIGFTPEQIERVFQAAQANGLKVKLHAEQLSDQKGACLAAKYFALSADHLEYIVDDGIKAMSQSGTVAVLLPGAYYFLKETRKPPIEALKAHKVPIAIATDCNPGTSPATSLLLMMNMACTLWQMTPQDCLNAVTIHAAKALGKADEIGSLETGKKADIAFWNIHSAAELSYFMGFNPCVQAVRVAPRATTNLGDHHPR